MRRTSIESDEAALRGASHPNVTKNQRKVTLPCFLLKAFQYKSVRVNRPAQKWVGDSALSGLMAPPDDLLDDDSLDDDSPVERRKPRHIHSFFAEGD